ncbi:hypothetical protein BDQ12DRAFT_236216 [Crucibulum laeve]|uniref:Hsp70 protein-domain-containing protein n=1 Tax=Crucibulum laeve TaxID=68775 RepID=A0A5C3M6B1_9AGAR|nr:hypothetical protein BDQ12DRAFT_236216 [Crucibulum laeve]
MKHAGDTRKPYSGLSRSLVIAIDVGTTFSGVSYAILEPGEIPKIHGVTRFPGQEHVAGNSKIPSVIYYDKHGKMMAAGAEADTSSVLAQAEEDGWIKAELFKLRLRPRTMTLNMNGMRLGLLPKRKTAVHVFGDFLAYMYRCTRNFITDTHANGAALWNAVEHDLQFVLSHPNGWEGAQQTKMRRAAVYGGLIPDSNEGKARIRFVTEGEASLHACVLNGLAADVLSNPSKHGFLIADAGGGTLDISAYAIRGTSPLVMEEIAPPDCIFAGSVFVSRRAREFLEEKLKKSKYGTPDALDHITRRFDETTKRLFRDRREMQFIPFGSPLDKDPNVGIRAGQLKLTGNEVANLFEPSVDAAVNAIKAQIEASQGIIKSVFLVGGYAASPWLFNQLQERLAPLRVSVNRPDTQTSKAVADGAIGFYCDHHVSARMSKFMYGVEFLRELNPADPDHVARRERLCELPSGPKLLPDAFDCILARSVKVKESTVFTRKYCTELTSLSMLSVFEVEIWCYRGGNTIPKWINRQADDFSTLCVVRADLSPLSGSAEPKTNRNGKTYWTIVFSVEIHFGLTEFKARIKWVDNGTTKYGPASIVYNERGHRSEEEEPDNIPEDDGYYSPRDRERDRERERDRDRTRDLRSEPASRARTPTDPYYVESRRTSASRSSPRADSMIPEVARVERTASKHSSSGYASAPTGSDSDRRRTMDKGKERERERDSRVSTPRHSTPGKIADVLSSTWDAPVHTSPVVVAAAAVPSRSPSIRDPGPTSIFDNPPPKSPSGGKSSWGDALGLDRTRSIGEAQSYFDAPPGDAPQLSWDAPKTPSADKSPFEQKKKSIFDDPVLPEEPPKSAFGVDASRSIFGDAPKSVFGDAPKSPFGDASRSPFGDASRSVFGDAPKSPWEATRERKISTTSNIASRNSPAIGASRSPFGKASEPVFEDMPTVAAAPSSPGTGLFGTTKSASKNASPIKPLSPLNPASQLHTPAVETLDPWDMSAGGNAQATTGASDLWGTDPVQSLHVEVPEQALSPKSSSVVPQEVAPVEQVKEPEQEQEPVTPITPGGKKKKKKGECALIFAGPALLTFFLLQVLQVLPPSPRRRKRTRRRRRKRRKKPRRRPNEKRRRRRRRSE